MVDEVTNQDETLTGATLADEVTNWDEALAGALRQKSL